MALRRPWLLGIAPAGFFLSSLLLAACSGAELSGEAGDEPGAAAPGSEAPDDLDDPESASIADELIVGRDMVPANYRDRRSARCDVGNQASATFTFREGPLAGHTARYYSSQELDYAKTSWPWQQTQSWTALDGKLGSDAASLAIVVVDIRNVGGVPHYHYYSNGSFNRLGQNWSSTKVLAEVAALHRIRLESGGRIGTDAIINDVGLGRRTFLEHTYRLHDTSDNASGGLFKHLAGIAPVDSGRPNATAFVRGWISRPADTFNGYYAYSSFDSYYLLRSNASSATVRLETPSDGRTSNLVTPLVMAEMWKRLGVNFRDPSLLPQGRGEGAGAETYAYRGPRGADDNAYRPASTAGWKPTLTEGDLLGLFWGSADPDSDAITGMVHDLGIRSRYTAALGGSSQLDGWTRGAWRIYAKTGWGSDNSALGGYMCLPKFKGGRELAFFVLGSAPDGTGRVRRALERMVDIFAPGLRNEAPKPDP